MRRDPSIELECHLAEMRFATDRTSWGIRDHRELPSWRDHGLGYFSGYRDGAGDRAQIAFKLTHDHNMYTVVDVVARVASEAAWRVRQLQDEVVVRLVRVAPDISALRRVHRDHRDLETKTEQLSNVVDEKVKHQAATSWSVVVVSLSVTFAPSLKLIPSSTSATSSWPLNRRQRSWAASSSL